MAVIAKAAVQAAPYAIDRVYSYLLPRDMGAQVGCRVLVPFGRGNRPSEAVILALSEGVPDKPLKTVSALLDEEPLLYINPTGRFVIGGPAGDAGLTGRKAVSDAYGGAAHHGGGSLAGKDPTKMDRTGAYLARYLAKNVVAAGLADRCEVQLAYAIGLADPVSVSVNTFGTGMIRDETLAVWLENHVDMRPGVVIRRFGLTRPIYRGLAAYGPFGENGRGMPWERTDLRFPAQF